LVRCRPGWADAHPERDTDSGCDSDRDIDGHIHTDCDVYGHVYADFDCYVYADRDAPDHPL
jgi:hypothetical protein